MEILARSGISSLNQLFALTWDDRGCQERTHFPAKSGTEMGPGELLVSFRGHGLDGQVFVRRQVLFGGQFFVWRRSITSPEKMAGCKRFKTPPAICSAR